MSGYICIAAEEWWLVLSFFTRDIPHVSQPHSLVPAATREQRNKLHPVLGFGTYRTLLGFLLLEEREQRAGKVHTEPQENMIFSSISSLLFICYIYSDTLSMYPSTIQ